jgi:hypothetical protein
MDDQSPHPVEDEQDLQQRINQLERQIAELQGELGRSQQPGRAPVDWRGQVLPLLVVVGIFLLAAIPGWLVFKDRWLGQPYAASIFSDLWARVNLLREATLPPYFGWVFVLCLALLAWVILQRLDSSLLFAEFKPASPGVDDAPEYQPWRRRWVQAAWLAAVLLLGGSFVYGLASGKVSGVGFGLALILYISGWLVGDPQVKNGLVRLWEQRQVVIAFLIAQIALILFMRSLAQVNQFSWLTAVFLVLAFAYLLRFYRQVPLILWIIDLALVLYTFNINRWFFSVIGDDFAFFNQALAILEKADLLTILNRMFEGQSVYGTHPYLSSALQSLSMLLLGKDSFGWRFGNLFLAAISIGFFYYFNKQFVRRPVALIAAVLMAASSYIMTFGKIGYNNLQALFAMALVLAAAGWAVRSRRWLAYTALGLSFGFCLYVYPAALYALPLGVLLILFYDLPKNTQAWQRYAFLLAGLAFMLVPLGLQPGYWQAKVPGLLVNNPAVVQSSSTVATHFGVNLLLSFFSFLYVVEESHFVAASYMDPLAAAFVLIGLALVIKSARRQRFAVYLLVGLLALLVLVGASHDRRFPPTTRMFLLLPWFTLFAAIGIRWLAERISAVRLVNLSWRSAVGLILVLVIVLNVYQAYQLSRVRSAGRQTPEVLFTRLVEEMQQFETDSYYPKTALFITDSSWSIDGYQLLAQVYQYPAAVLNLDRAIVSGPQTTATTDELIQHRNTLVFFQPGLNAEWVQQLADHLSALGKLPCEVKEYSGRDVRFTFWHHPDLTPLCQAVNTR